MKFKTAILVFTLISVFSCDQKDEKKEELYVQLRKKHEYYKKAQNRIDTNLKKTEEDLLKVKEDVQNELGYFSNQYQEFQSDLDKFLTILEEKAGSHEAVLYEQSVLEDEIFNERLKYEEALAKERQIAKKREELERNFIKSLSQQDTLFHKASKLINKNSRS